MIIIDDVLCFIQTARNGLDEFCIGKMAVAYYTPEMILSAKERHVKRSAPREDRLNNIGILRHVMSRISSI